MEIKVGLSSTASTTVEREDTAQIVGSGSLLVYATPCMVALMEGAACEALKDLLPEDKTTVGIEISVKHISATPIGLDVTAHAQVTEIDGSIITFHITAEDESGPIGEAVHKRAIISTQRFLDKAYSKL